MSDQEQFLARWSRRKLEGNRGSDDGKKNNDKRNDVGNKDTDADRPPTKQTADKPPDRPAAEPAQFDLSKLPPIESIMTPMDVRPFLLAGVPQSVRNAALRRAWSVDPTTRDFIEMAEYAWDFTTENALQGFGSLNASDVPDILERLVRTEEPKQAPGQDVEAAGQSDGKHDELEPSVERVTPQGNEVENAGGPDFQIEKIEHVQTSMLQCGTDADGGNMALADQTSEDTNARPAHRRRGHGGALPR